MPKAKKSFEQRIPQPHVQGSVTASLEKGSRVPHGPPGRPWDSDVFISGILKVLGTKLDGANISTISEETGYKRETVAKYLEMLRVRGKVRRLDLSDSSKVYKLNPPKPSSLSR